MIKGTRSLREAWGSLAVRFGAPALAVALAAACGPGGSSSTSSTGGANGGGSTTSTTDSTSSTGTTSTGTGGMTGTTTTGTGGTGNTTPVCASNADCANSPKGKICDPSTGFCVVCLASDDQCPQGQFCDPTINQCKVGCTDASDCAGGADLLCDTDSHTCVGCVIDTDCPKGAICFPMNKVCVPGCSASQGCQQGATCCGSSCFDTATNTTHCGSCDKNCTVGVDPPASCGNGTCDPGDPNDPSKPAETCESCPGDCDCHASPVCVASMCGLSACDAAYANCNGDLTDGCEWNVLQDGPCLCAPGSTQACYYGGPGTLGKGQCVAGTQTCDATGAAWGACIGQVLPKPELCGNNVDDDCNGVIDDVADADADGWTTCNGDCCDSAGPSCPNPKLVNPGAFEVPGNNVDDDCDPSTPDSMAAPTCSAAASFSGVTAMQMAQALDICQTTTAAPPKSMKKWGLITAQQLLANGSVPNATDLGNIQNAQAAILANYGAVVVPHKGATMVGISSGMMRDQFDAGYVAPNGGSSFVSAVQPPGAYLAAHAGALPSSAGCSGMCPSGSGANDSVNLRMSIRTPTNAQSFSYDFRFFSAEYWLFQCTQYNDFYLALLQSAAPGIPADKNISFDAMTNPISVNNGFFDVCVAKGCNVCAGGIGDLAGTGMQLNNTGGATTWLTTDAPIIPGETIQLELMIFDVTDHVLDSVALIDNFRWNLQPSVVGTHQ